jgi:uncharacterized protein (DUF58 family)
LVGTAAAALLAARAPTLHVTPLVSKGSRGVIVLDLSASTQHEALDRIYAALTQLAHSRGRFGLVIFSSRAYEALPPDTSARELLPIARFFHELAPSASSPNVPIGSGPAYPANPWAYAFSFGTSISQGLDLARTILIQDHVEPRSVWLISDLADAQQDRSSVIESAESYVDSSIALHVIGVDPLKKDLRFFKRLVGPRGSIKEARPSAQVRLRSEHAFPVGLTVAASTLAILLALNELVSVPLRWTSRRPAVVEEAM